MAPSGRGPSGLVVVNLKTSRRPWATAGPVAGLQAALSARRWRIGTGRSGLDDTMRAFQAMRETWHGREDVTDLRTAAYLVSIGKVAAVSNQGIVTLKM